MLPNHSDHRENNVRRSLLRRGSGGNRDEATDQTSVQGGPDFRCPWRVEDFETTHHAFRHGYGYRFERLYVVVDRLGVTVGYFLEREAAEFAVQSVNK